MTITHYLDLYQLLARGINDREANRAFGLEHEKTSPLAQLDAWRDAHLSEIDRPRWSETYARYRYGIGLVLGVVALVVGLFSGAALLSYSGREPVNVVYFLAMAVGVPLVTMGLALLSMVRAGSAHNALVHLSPASWMTKIAQLFPSFGGEALAEVRIHPRLANWLVIERAQMMAWWFALGLLLSLVGIVVTRDVAFAWSTTLSVSPEQFHGWLEMLSAPWRGWIPAAIPSAELIEQSQHYRLGGALDGEMVRHAAQLGAWWKFLAAATLFYAVGLRLLMWIGAKIGLHRVTGQAILALPGATRLLHEMNTPLVTTAATVPERGFAPDADGYERTIRTLEPRWDRALGWAMDAEGMRVMLDALSVRADRIEAVGGTRSLADDAAVVERVGGEILLLVKAWEPPTMDWVDLLGEIAERADRVVVAPMGTPEQTYAPRPKEVAIWGRKLQQIDHPKVWLWEQ